MNYQSQVFKDNQKEIFYVLHLAFARDLKYSKIENYEKVIYFSDKFGLSERIGCKMERTAIFIEDTLKKYFLEKYRENIKKNLLSLALCSKINGVSKKLGVSVIFLKGCSLLLEEKTKLGSRNIADVDILVSSEDARNFYNYLLSTGWISKDNIEEEAEHLPSLKNSFGVLEIHTRLPFIFLKEKKEKLDFKKIMKLNGIQKIVYQEEEYFVLSRPLLFVYLFAHGFFQHYYFPDYYSPFKGLTDLQDLNISQNEKEKFISFINENFCFPLKEEFIRNTFDLLEFLEKGEEAELDILNPGSKNILFHLINGCLDSRYVYSLRIKGLKNKYIFKNYILRNILVLKDLISYFIRKLFKTNSFQGFKNLIKNTINFIYCRTIIFFKSIFSKKK